MRRVDVRNISATQPTSALWLAGRSVAGYGNRTGT
jgi:hypothetical protein